jgi:ribosomal protein S18 acetylase RimI-like enzyme
MSSNSLAIVPCPSERLNEALAVVLCDLAPSQRREIGGALTVDSRGPRHNTAASPVGLFVAMRGEQLVGAVWAQHQPGNTAVLWPPQLAVGEREATAARLADTAVAELDRAAVSMSQVLLPDREGPFPELLEAVGFRHLAELLYLTCEAERFPAELPQMPGNKLSFLEYDKSLRGRLARLIELTYQGTLDCPTLNGARSLDDILVGYQATGVYRPENWLIVRCDDHDVGMLLLADHPQAGHLELVYMGLVPEARGRGWGRQVTHHAQRVAQSAGAERIVLAVDADNEPALRMYRSAGFEAWDRRSVYVRFCQ